MIKSDVFENHEWFGTVCDKDGLAEKAVELATSMPVDTVYSLKTAAAEVYTKRYWELKGGVVGAAAGCAGSLLAILGYLCWYNTKEKRKQRRDQKHS